MEQVLLDTLHVLFCAVFSFIATIKNGGAAANVVPEYASLMIMYRAPTIAELDELAQRVDNCVKAGALLSATESKVSRPQPAYLPLRSNTTLGKLYKQHCEKDGMIPQ